MGQNTKNSDRKKYNPDGPNEYTAPQKQPKRQDKRDEHRRVTDDLDQIDNYKDKEMNRNSTKDAVKRLLKKAKYDPNEEMHTREGVESFKYGEKGMKQLATVYKNVANAFMSMTSASNQFSRCKSSEISPDGKLGGKGYVQPIKSVRAVMSECVNSMSELIDTLHDEVNSPYWKKTTMEDHPAVKGILSEANDIVDKAEDMEEKTVDPKEPKNLILSDNEKDKIKNILKNKGH